MVLWTGGAARVHGGPKAARTRGAVVLHRREARERSGSLVLTGVGRGVRGRRGGAGGRLTGAREVEERRHGGSGRRRWKTHAVWALVTPQNFKLWNVTKIH
jgi:hypothetical protein